MDVADSAITIRADTLSAEGASQGFRPASSYAPS